MLVELTLVEVRYKCLSERRDMYGRKDSRKEFHLTWDLFWIDMKDREEVPVGSGPEACRHETHETQTWDLSTNLYDWVFNAKSLTHQKRVNSGYFLSRETSANASILVFCVCHSLTEFVKLQQLNKTQGAHRDPQGRQAIHVLLYFSEHWVQVQGGEAKGV